MVGNNNHAQIHTKEAQERQMCRNLSIKRLNRHIDQRFYHLLIQISSVLYNNTYYKLYTILIYLYTHDQKCTVQFTHIKY